MTPGRATPTLFWRRPPPPPRPRVLIAACGVARGTGRGTPTRRRPHKTAPPRAQQVHVGHQRRRPLTGAVFRRPDIVSCLPFFLHQLIIDRPFGGHYAAVSKGLWKRAPGGGGGTIDGWLFIEEKKIQSASSAVEAAARQHWRPFIRDFGRRNLWQWLDPRRNPWPMVEPRRFRTGNSVKKTDRADGGFFCDGRRRRRRNVTSASSRSMKDAASAAHQPPPINPAPVSVDAPVFQK